MILSELRARCPSCGSLALPLVASTARESTCARCGVACALPQGFLDLAPDVARSTGLSQRLMEWPPLVRLYESRLWRRSLLFAAVTRISFDRECELITAAAELGGDEALLDVACGSGLYSRRLAALLGGGCVVGLDVSDPMLAHAARRAAEQQVDNLALVRGSALSIPFSDETFDRVSCAGALHVMTDPAVAVREAARVLRPGGRYVLAVVRRRPTRLAASVWRRREKILGLRAFTEDGLADLLGQCGFEAPVWHHAAGLWMIASARKATRPRT